MKFWPKRDEDGRHVNTGAEHGGPIANFKPSCEPDPVETFKPLSELLAKLDPDIAERAREDSADDLKCAKCDGHQIIALGGEIYNCECQE